MSARPPHLPIRGSSLDAAYHCGLAASLSHDAPREQTEYTLAGNMFDAGLEFVAGGYNAKDAISRYETYAAQLPSEERDAIDEEIDRVGKKMDPLNKLKLRLKAQEKWALGPDGMAVDYDSPHAITRGRADWIWQEENPSTVHVVDFKRGFGPFPGPYESLQVGAAGIAAMQYRECDYARLYIVHLPPDGQPRINATEPLDINQLEGIWQRVKLAVERDPGLANKGPHCDMCHQRARCPAWILPAIDTKTRDNAFSPLWTPGILTREKVLEMLKASQALKKVLELAQSYIKADIHTRGPLRDGEKEYRLIAMPGRQSVSLERLKHTGLYEEAVKLGAVKTGATIYRAAWCNAKGQPEPDEGEGGKSNAA